MEAGGLMFVRPKRVDTRVLGTQPGAPWYNGFGARKRNWIRDVATDVINARCLLDHFQNRFTK